MDSLLIVLAALAPDTFFHRPYAVGAWTRWSISGDVNLLLSRRREPSETGFLWKIVLENLSLEVLLSEDRSELISVVMLEEGKEKKLIPGAEMWYVPLESACAEKQASSILSTEEICETILGNFSCTKAEFFDEEGNHFRWLLSEEVIGGVVQYEISFKGTPTRMLRYTLIEHGK